MSDACPLSFPFSVFPFRPGNLGLFGTPLQPPAPEKKNIVTCVVFQSNLRKQIRNLPKILKFAKIIHFTGVRADPSRGPGPRLGARPHAGIRRCGGQLPGLGLALRPQPQAKRSRGACRGSKVPAAGALPSNFCASTAVASQQKSSTAKRVPQGSKFKRNVTYVNTRGTRRTPRRGAPRQSRWRRAPKE